MKTAKKALAILGGVTLLAVLAAASGMLAAIAVIGYHLILQ